jgi:hypothetical protein
VELVNGEGRNSFQPDERDSVRELQILTFLDEVIVVLSDENDDVVHLGSVGSRVIQDGSERSEPSPSIRRPCAWRALDQSKSASISSTHYLFFSLFDGNKIPTLGLG